MSHLVVLDAMGLAYRAYYAFIARPLLNSRGENTSAIFGFANTVLKVRREEKPDYWALAWDGPGPTFRHERFADYKATRKPMPGDLLSQIEPIEQVAAALGLPVIEVPGMEADDVMATLAERGRADGHRVTLVTSDKDMLQLVDDQVTLLSPVGRGEDYTRVDAAAVQAKWGVAPGQIRDVLALMGDSSDNVPGVPGVGEKTAVELIVAFGSLDALYDRLAEVKRPALREKLGAHRERAYLSRDLVTVRRDCPLEVRWEDLKRGMVRREALIALAHRYELQRLERIAEQLGTAEAAAGPAPPARPAERQGTAAETPAPGVKLDQARTPKAAPLEAGTAQGTLDLFAAAPAAAAAGPDLEAQVREVVAQSVHGLGLLPVFEGDHPRRARLVGLALAARSGASAYVPLGHEGHDNVPAATLREWIGPTLADPAIPRLGEDLKRDAHLLEAVGCDLALPAAGPLYDLHLLSSLCDPERDHGLEALTQDFAGFALPRPAENGPRRARPSSWGVESGLFAARAATALFPVARALRAQLEARDQWRLYETIERPLLGVLRDMERHGIRLDPAPLAAMAEEAGAEIERLRATLIELAGAPVNLDSGPQVAQVLFEVLGLKPRGRTPGGANSTRQEVLEELAAQHAFPARLLEYRALTKLRSTYLDALPAEVDPRDGRVHTVFEQAGAATGRLSSSQPNLQNIPMRTERGRRIRRAFVAEPGAVLVGADYSQIELRVMAHLSGDPGLVAAFAGGEDIHASTARRIFGVTGALDPALRARAKIVNFGIMYGMGARSLAQQMGIGLAEAQAFIADYFRTFPGVRAFLDHTVEEARRRGFVETLLGRRRYLPGLESGHGGERSYTERAAINTPIQGSAADLVKLAMLRVHHVLPGRFPSARLLLQVHDELLLECAAGDAEAVAGVVRSEMEGCFPLRVPLVVSVGRGASWFDVH